MDWLDGGEDLLTAQREFGRIIRHLKAELFGLIRLASGERLATKERMTNAVIEPAVFSGKPKNLLDGMRDVRKTRARFQASEANVVEAFAAANACSGSVLDTTPINREQATAIARLLANIRH